MMYCQKCRTPLRLDSSLEDLNPAAYDLLVTAASQQPAKSPTTSRQLSPQEKTRKSLYERSAKNAGTATFKRHSGATLREGGPRDSSAMSFILLTESQVAPPVLSPTRESRSSAPPPSAVDGSADTDDVPQAHETERITKLFEILSARSDIDHPVCVECTDMLVEGLQIRLQEAAQERESYVSYIKKKEADAPAEDEIAAQKLALEKAWKQESEAVQELRRLEKEKASVDEEIIALEEESRQLDLEEEEFWRERNAFATKLSDFQNERDSINSKFDHDSRLLEKLQRSNVYNDTFCISHDGTFATINGLRLGRLSSKPVDWPEINAAWGHALLLLVTVADKLNYKFDGYEPQPMGSTSRIIRYEAVSPASSRYTSQRNPPPPPPAPKKHVLELFSSGDMPLGLTFLHRKFDNAMVAFLELVRQLGVFVERHTAAEGSPLSLPYRIEGDRIAEVSIKLGIAQDDGWTKACKLTLTCCKFLLAHASNVNSVANSRAAGN